MLTGLPLTDRERAVVDAVPRGLLIGAARREASNGRTFAVDDPSTGLPLCEVPDATPQDGLDALAAAAAVQPAWAVHPPRERGEILRRAYETVVRRIDDLALLMTLEMGKPVAESKAEILYAAEFLRWFSEEAVRIEGSWTVAPSGTARFLVMRQPVGPCVMVTPWNFPMAMGTRKIAPAIAAGCTMVIKPAELTPLSMLELARILEEAGLPPGVLNVVTTESPGELVEPLLRDPRTRKLSFTGSTAVGRRLAAEAAPNLLRVSLELGGNAPFLVFDDADLDAAVEGAMIAKMRNAGQACVAANRFLVADRIAPEFAGRLAERMSALRVGRGSDPQTQVGPLVDEPTRDKVTRLVEDACARGAELLTGGSAIDGPGHFFQPTVLTDVPSGARMLREEIFGPVAPIVSVGSEEEAIASANDTEFGLVAFVYTRDLARALRVVEALQTGMVGLNQGLISNAAAPFGGVKQSGYGREGGREGIQEYTEVKYVSVAGGREMTHGPLALVGSGEFLPVMRDVDAELLDGRPQRAVFLPTAAALEGDERIGYWIDLGTAHYRSMGVEPVPLRVLTRENADDPDLAAQVDGAGLIYLSGGNPGHLVETLRDTVVWRAIHAAWEAGSALAGCSAGAIALSAVVPDPRSTEIGRIEPALRVAPHLAVIPHFDRFDRVLPRLATRIRAETPAHMVTVGIDEDTALVGGLEEWTVRGRQRVWIIQADDERDGYRSGTRLDLPLPAGPG